MLSFSSRDDVATTTRKTPERSEGSKGRACQDILPACAQCDTSSVASGATTLTVAPAANKPSILGSPTRPAPTTRHERPVSFKNTGNKPILDPSNMGTRGWGLGTRGWGLGAGETQVWTAFPFPAFPCSLFPIPHSLFPIP